jgi:integrase
VHLDGVDQLVAILDAARELDADRRRQSTGRYALVATLMFAGPRATEASEALVRDLDFARRGSRSAGPSRTRACGRSTCCPSCATCSPSTRPACAAASTIRCSREDNIRKRVLEPVIARADELLAESGQHPLPKGVTPHKLRHTFASILVACGRDPAYVMAQLGHTDPAFTLRVYAHAMRFSDEERARLKALVEGRDWAPAGTSAAEPVRERVSA